MPLPTIMTIPKNLYGGLGVSWWHPEEIRWLSPSGNIMPPSHNNDVSKKNFGCRDGMVEPWRNTLAKSKQNHNALPIIMTIPKEFVVGVTWWHPEEVPWLSRSRSIMPLPTIMTIPKNGFRGWMVAPWRNTLTKSKQKRNALSHNNDNSKKMCMGGMVAPWRNTLAKSKPKHNTPSHNNDNSKKNGCTCGMLAPEEIP